MCDKVWKNVKLSSFWEFLWVQNFLNDNFNVSVCAVERFQALIFLLAWETSRQKRYGLAESARPSQGQFITDFD